MKMVGFFLNNKAAALAFIIAGGRMLAILLLLSHASVAAASNDTTMFQTSPSLLTTVDHSHADDAGAMVPQHDAPAATSNNHVLVSFFALMNSFHVVVSLCHLFNIVNSTAYYDCHHMIEILSSTTKSGPYL